MSFYAFFKEYLIPRLSFFTFKVDSIYLISNSYTYFWVVSLSTNKVLINGLIYLQYRIIKVQDNKYLPVPFYNS